MAVYKPHKIVQEPSIFPDAGIAPLEQPEEEYTEGQFHADLAKASQQVDAMAAKALQSLREGRVRKFPA